MAHYAGTDGYGNEIDGAHGVPTETISCPGCGRKYGHHRTTVCKECEECSSCCKSATDCKHSFVSASVMIERVLREG